MATRRDVSSGDEAKRGFRALVASFVLGVLGLIGAGVAFAVPQRGVALALAIAACFAFAAFCASLVSFRGGRTGPSIAALLASLLVLFGVVIAFGSVSIMGFVEAVQRNQPEIETHVDEDYQFELEAPTYDTILYDERVAQTINDRAVAGMWVPEEELTVLVFVEQLYGRSLETAALEDCKLAIGMVADLYEGAPTRVTYAEADAVRIQRGFSRDEGAAWGESTFFVHADLLYHVYAESVSERPLGDPWFPTALDAFTIVDGDVHPRFTPREVIRDDGPDWRIRNNTYEDAGWGVRVRGDGFRLAYGSHVAGGFDRSAVVILSRRHPDVDVAVVPHFVGGLSEVDADDLLAAEGAFVSDASPRELEVSGQSLAFVTYSEPSDRTWHFRTAIWRDETRAIEIVASAPTLEALDAHLPEMLSRVDIVDEAGTAALRRVFARRPSEWHDVGASWWIRGESFVDRYHQVEWRRPDARWRVSSDGLMDGSSMVARLGAPSLGLEGEIVQFFREPDEELSLEDAHREWAEDQGRGERAPAEPEPHRFADGAMGLVSHRIDLGGGRAAALTTRAGNEDSILQIQIVGSASVLDRHGAEVRAALESLTVMASEAELDARTDRDTRMGYTFVRPWREPAETNWDTLGETVGSLVEYRRGDEVVGILAARRAPTMTPVEQRDVLLDRLYADMLDAPGTWRERRARLGGRACTLRERTAPFGLGGASMYTLDHEGILYVLVVQHMNRLDPADLARGFSLLR